MAQLNAQISLRDLLSMPLALLLLGQRFPLSLEDVQVAGGNSLKVASLLFPWCQSFTALSANRLKLESQELTQDDKVVKSADVPHVMPFPAIPCFSSLVHPVAAGVKRSNGLPSYPS